MKNRMQAILITAFLLLNLAGCSAVDLARQLDDVEDRAEHRIDQAEDALEEAVQRAVSPAPAAIPEVPVAVPQETGTAPANAEQITSEEAERIALEYVGLKADQVQHLRTEFEIDDGVPQYDVEFYEGNWEYEFEIDAKTGNILSYDRDDRWD